MYEDDDRDDSCPYCENCGTPDVKRIPEEEKIYGLGLYEIYGFRGGGLDKNFKVYRCSECGHEW